MNCVDKIWAAMQKNCVVHLMMLLVLSKMAILSLFKIK